MEHEHRLRHRGGRRRSRAAAGRRGDGSDQRQGRLALAHHGGLLRSDWVVNAGGLGSDVLNRRFGHDEFTITPRRGQLIVFDKLARGLVSSIVLPVPTERTKGVLVAPTVYGNVLLGPTAEDVP